MTPRISSSPWCAVKVNGRRALDHMLADGDIFQIGKRKFRYSTT